MRFIASPHQFRTTKVAWRGAARCAVAISLVGMLAHAYAASNLDALQLTFTQRWGDVRLPQFSAWRTLLGTMGNETALERIKSTGTFFNRSTLYGDDVSVWGQVDYWATPLETMGRGAGDCEDYAIAKYFSLLEVGVAPEKLRLVYVRAKTGSGDNLQIQAHMVLVYYPQPDAEPLVMDNLINDIRPASKRPDLIPVFSFNKEGVFSGVSEKTVTSGGGTARLSRWENLLIRTRAEGFQ